MRNLICCCCLFHFFFILLSLFLHLPPTVAVVVYVPVPFTSPFPSSYHNSSLDHTDNNDYSGECDALLRFSNSFTITKDASQFYCDSTSYARTVSWKEGGSDCCSWDGVTCDHATSHVIGLDLSCSWLQGPLRSNSSLFSLSNLRLLNLTGNHFRGSEIPSRFGIFKEMTHLNLSYNGFRGQVPLDQMVSHLSGLISLDLSSSHCETLTLKDAGNLGRVLRNLTKLRVLVLDWVDMSSVDPISLTNLSSALTTLSLNFCNLRGTFPVDIFHLPNLQTLSLSDNSNLTGTLPHKNWSSSLMFLHLSDTKFHGPIPASIGNLTSMNHLVLSQSSFTGPIPPTLCKLNRIARLDLSNNKLSSSVNDFAKQHGDENCSMSRLQYLSLSHCGLTRFPYFLSSSAKLTGLDLSENNISGSIPKWFWSVARDTIVELDLSYNNFTGEISPSICQMRSLAFLDLSSNALSSTLPRCLGNLSNLVTLSLQSNKFHGSIAEVSLPSGLTYLTLSKNNFGGPLPIPLPATIYYVISNNRFTGDIPHQICNVTSLQAIDLSNNNLAGSIPHCFRNLSGSLTVLDLRANKFVGRIPDIFNHNCKLQTIRLSQNSLHGELPRSLADCEYLKILDASGNKLEGPFPHWLDTLPHLQVLSLRSNQFYGAVGDYGRVDHPFSKLRIFDISNNIFSGPLPVNYLANLTAMKNTENTYGYLYMDSYISYYEESIEMVVKGSEIELERILNVFTTIDFSSNLFDDEIPEAIGDLMALKGLNFSHNNLIGNIPSSLGNLTNLEWLDLSSNKLHGDIPGGLALLSSLGTLNLSNNQLVGQIPQSTQFDSFTSRSFGGNPGLCGHPLPKLCENDAGQTTATAPHREEEIDSDNWIEWGAVLMGYGCGLVLALSTWYVMMETRRPSWLVGMTERCLLKIVERERLNHRTNRPGNNL